VCLAFEALGRHAVPGPWVESAAVLPLALGRDLSDTIASVAVLSVVCTVIAFLLFFALIREVGPSRTTVITYVNPLVAVLLGVALLGESFTLGIAVGMPLILVGSVLATSRTRGGEPGGGRDEGKPREDELAAEVPAP